MKKYIKKDFPVSEIRRFLEPGPVVLLSTALKGENNIMTMGWHTVLEFTPSLIGCMISEANHSFEMVKRSRECVINLPTEDLAKKVVGIGTCSGRDTDKFKAFGLTPAPGSKVRAPLIKECYGSFECKIAHASLVNKYNFFILEVVNAHVATTPKYPKTIHYRGDNLFMVSGRNIKIPSMGLIDPAHREG